MFLFKRKKKVQKTERHLDEEQIKRQKEIDKWTKILQNVAAYDGTGKGQIKIER